MTPPSVQDHTADHERLYAAIRKQIDAPIMQTGYRILQKLPGILFNSGYRATVTVGRRGGTTEVIEVDPGDHSRRNFAVAVDLGTTTVVAHLVDLTTAATLDTEATYNSQLNFGEDYIRRIIYAEQNDAFDEMQNRIVRDVNNLIMALAMQAEGRSAGDHHGRLRRQHGDDPFPAESRRPSHPAGAVRGDGQFRAADPGRRDRHPDQQTGPALLPARRGRLRGQRHRRGRAGDGHVRQVGHLAFWPISAPTARSFWAIATGSYAHRAPPVRPLKAAASDTA